LANTLRQARKENYRVSKQRLQKILATQGLGSRRMIEGWISAGEVKLNGVTAQLGDVAGIGDVIDVRGQKITVSDEEPIRRVIIYHKPEGEITSTSDPEGRPTVFAALPAIRQGRWITVGRLDFNTSGLLLATNDGELANRLMHPSHQIERTYAVRVLGGLTDDQIKQLTTEVQLDDGPAKFDQLSDAGGTGVNRWYHVTLREGRNREIRRMIEAVGAVVSRLIRISYAGIPLPPRLKPGRAQDLPPEMEDALVKLVGLRPETRRKVQDEDTKRRALKPYRARVQTGTVAKRPAEPFRVPARAQAQEDAATANRPTARPIERVKTRMSQPGEARPVLSRARPQGAEAGPDKRSKPAGAGSKPIRRERQGTARTPAPGRKPSRGR